MAPNYLKCNRLAFCTVIVLMIMHVFAFADAEIIEINTLINDSVVYDGQTVTLTGETLLSGLKQGDMRWININDGTNAIGLFMDLQAYGKVKWYGSYGVTGDQVLVAGLFNRACSVHGGDMDVHVNTLTVTDIGHKKSVVVEPTKMYLALLLLLTTLVILAVYNLSQKRVAKL